MSENIELHSYCISTTNDSGIEEYHEISQELLHDKVNSPKYSVNTLKQFDFFTQFDVQPLHKLGQKKKMSKKKEQSPNLMDIISSELASTTVPVTGNVITLKQNERNSFLLRTPSLQSLFGKPQPLRLDSEFGWGRKPQVRLSPIFPRVLENIPSEEYSIPVQYVDPVYFEDLITEKQTDETEKHDKFLDVNIKNIKFKHHHSFSLEKMLCVKLVDLYDEYNVVKRLLNELSRDIRVNRETRDNLKQEFLKISPNKKGEIRFDHTVRKYTGRMLQLKEQYIELINKYKEMVHQIISLWSDVETVREKCGHVVTPYSLEIVCQDLDQSKFEEQWTDTYNVEFSDLLDKIEYDYVTKYFEYKNMKNLESTNKKINKPKLLIDEEELQKKVESLVDSILNRDKIDMTLKMDEKLISGQRKTIKDDSKYNFHFEIYVDDVFVCKSEGYICRMNDAVSEIDLTESFSVQILPKNKTITIVLNENTEEVSNLSFDLCKISHIESAADYTTKNFVYKNVIIQPTSRYVGSGYNIKDVAKESKVRLKSSNIFKGNLETTCEVGLKMGWNEKVGQNQCKEIQQSMDIGRKLKRLISGVVKPNLEILVEIMENIYGKDVGSNDKVISTLQKICKSKIRTTLEFPIDENSPEFVRLKLLQIRNIGGFSNVEKKMVPLHVSQITTEQLNCLQKSNQKDIDVEYINEKYAETNPIELQRFIGSKYVQKLNENMLRNLHEHLMKKTHKDVVRDYRDLSLRSLFSKHSKLTTLASIPTSTKQKYMSESLGKEQEIKVSVLRAYNLMDRSSAILSEDNDDDGSTIAGFKVRPLRPYIRLSYHGVSAQTATAIGCHPTWNQTVKIKTKLQPLSTLHINVFDECKGNITDSYSDDDTHGNTGLHKSCSKWLGTLQVPINTILTLGTLRGTFKINTPPLVFGYEVSQKKDTTHSLIPEVSQLLRKETSFLSLQISTSLSQFGGLHGYNQPIPSSVDDDSLIKHLNTIVTEYTNDFPSRNISLTFIDSSGRNKCITQFLQPIPIPDYEVFPKNPKGRAESALSKSSGFSKSSSSRSSGGRRKEIDIEKASQSPGGERESDYSGHEGSRIGENQLIKMMNAALRYVALIPTYEVTESHVVTLLGVELLRVLYGSPLDHTLLLASYFLYLGIKCWVVIGQGLPRGQSSFVLTKYDLTNRRDVLVTDQLFKTKGFLNKGDGYLWNVYDPTTGERYELRDVSCPLKTVDYLFDNENIWLNTQNYQDCESLSFDLSKSSYWMPVFDKTIFVMKQPLITESGLYSAPPDVASLREMLESKIKIKMQKWRPQLKTIWNRYCGSLLREVLPYWEYWSFNPTDLKPGLSHRLRQLMITYKLFGFPLNMPYVNAKSVISTVKSTGMHVNNDPNVEYGLAVEVYAYPNNVLSVWVFLASITRI